MAGLRTPGIEPALQTGAVILDTYRAQSKQRKQRPPSGGQALPVAAGLQIEKPRTAPPPDPRTYWCCFRSFCESHWEAGWADRGPLCCITDSSSNASEEEGGFREPQDGPRLCVPAPPAANLSKPLFPVGFRVAIVQSGSDLKKWVCIPGLLFLITGVCCSSSKLP